MNFLAAKKRYFEYYRNLKKDPTEDKEEVIRRVSELWMRSDLDGYTSSPKRTLNIVQDFYEEEWEITRDNPSPKIQEYHLFLTEIGKKMQFIFFVKKGNNYNNTSIGFQEYAQPKLGMDFMDLRQMGFELSGLFDVLDRLHFKEFFLDKPIPQEEAKKILNKEFNFANNASPIVFIEYPRELAIYKRLLKNWLLMEIEKRRRQFTAYFPEFPAIYDCITDYADRLLDPREINYLTINTPEYYQYPQHIFKSFKGFKLLEYYAETLVNEAQFTFLYRYMRDMEREDFKIIADPKTFNEWFREKNYIDEIYVINGTLSKVLTKEREQNYTLIKKMINQLYALA
ncbi:MAG TPA: hypothetical protein VFM82_06025 [Flavobacteriaceae bacterium]|nr:hypothetical protein [Flavobacteriaceae bacterium]